MRVTPYHRIWGKITILIGLILAVGGILFPFWIPLFIGAVFTIVLLPFYKRLLNYLDSPQRASLAAISIFTIAILVPIILVTLRGAKLTIQFTEQYSTIKPATEHSQSAEIDIYLKNFGDTIGFDLPASTELYQKVISWGAGYSFQLVSDFFAGLPGFFINLFISILVMYYALVHHKEIEQVALKTSLLNITSAKKVLAAINHSCRTVVFANLITGFIQAFVIALASALTGSGDFFVVVFATFVFSFIPIIGAAPVGLLLAIIQISQGNHLAAAVMTAIALFAGVIDNIIRPYLLSDTEESGHALLGLLSVLGGVFLFGLPGLFLGPLVVSIGVRIIPIYLKDLNFHEDTAKHQWRQKDYL
jgi:predicted PurR-regulated permease PerM